MQAKRCKVVKGGDDSWGLQHNYFILFRKGWPTEIFHGDKNSYLCPWDPEIQAVPLKNCFFWGFFSICGFWESYVLELLLSLVSLVKYVFPFAKK